jgi:hypothetical protein
VSTRLPCGLHFEQPAALYHADPAERPSLSSSVAKIILEKTPRHAWTAHPRLNPNFKATADKKFDLGNVAHELILGRGGEFEEVEADGYQTKQARADRDAIIAAGKTPILTDQLADAMQMADAVSDRLESMGIILDPHWSEVVGIWEDRGGALCRFMADNIDERNLTVRDLKTTGRGMSDRQLMSTGTNLGYDLSAGFYIRGLEAIDPSTAGRWKWEWIFIEDEEPFEVRIVRADAVWLEIGDRKAATAIEKWRVCMRSGDWPGYPPSVTTLEYPAYELARWQEREMVDDDCLRAAYTTRVVEREATPIMGPC